jgi:rhamnulose-1-phosphate aldolase
MRAVSLIEDLKNVSRYIIALSFILPLDTHVVTRELWEMKSECLVLFPAGVGVLEWMVPGSLEIGHATARLMEQHRLVLWAHHGIFGAGENMDQVFGLIETADKAAEMLLKVMAAGGKKQAILAHQLKALAKAFGVQPLKGALY